MMKSPAQFEFVREYYSIEQTVVVGVNIGGNLRQVKIEVRRERSGRYSTHAFIADRAKAPPSVEGDVSGMSEEWMDVWKDFPLPWVDRPSAEEALSQTMGFLGERVDRPTPA